MRGMRDDKAAKEQDGACGVGGLREWEDMLPGRTHTAPAPAPNYFEKFTQTRRSPNKLDKEQSSRPDM